MGRQRHAPDSSGLKLQTRQLHRFLWSSRQVHGKIEFARECCENILIKAESYEAQCARTIFTMILPYALSL